MEVGLIVVTVFLWLVVAFIIVRLIRKIRKGP